MATNLLYDADSISRLAPKTEYAKRTGDLISLLTLGSRGAHIDDFPKWVEDASKLPTWLLLDEERAERRAITWAFDPYEGTEWVWADRVVMVNHWPCYCRLAHWPEDVLRFATHPHRNLLRVDPEEKVCNRQNVYYHEASLADLPGDPFLFLKA